MILAAEHFALGAGLSITSLASCWSSWNPSHTTPVLWSGPLVARYLQANPHFLRAADFISAAEARRKINIPIR